MVPNIKMAQDQAANSPVFGPFAKGFETVCKQYFSVDVIPSGYGRCDLLVNYLKIFVYCSFKI